MQEEPTVFLVDDDDALRDALGVLLRMSGFRVESFASAEAFLAAFRDERPGCLVLDVRMPGMSGLELQERLARRGSTLPIIIITGHGDVPMAVSALKAGALDFFEKPFDDARLMARIRDAIESDRRERQGRQDLSETIARIGQLSPRELEVMQLITEGCSNKVIANRLGISVRTVETHRARVMDKTGAHSVSELTRMMLKLQSESAPS